MRDSHQRYEQDSQPGHAAALSWSAFMHMLYHDCSRMQAVSAGMWLASSCNLFILRRLDSQQQIKAGAVRRLTGDSMSGRIAAGGVVVTGAPDTVLGTTGGLCATTATGSFSASFCSTAPFSLSSMPVT